jgi:hypothetical protein
MTYDQAIIFFHRYGNVGRSEADLKSLPPTETQLQSAVLNAARTMGIELAQEAAQIIREQRPNQKDA